MRRFIAPVTLVVVLVAWAAIARGTTTSAQDDADLADHPLVGAWMIDTDGTDPENTPSLAVFSSDGLYVQHDYDGSAAVGSWEATGDDSAAMTAHQQFPGDDGEFGGTAVIRAEIEVAEDGETLTATYTAEFLNPDGTTSGELGPGEAEGTRIGVEPMGSPVASFEEAFAEEGAAATPEP